jgi:hypothetical protein
LKKLILSDIDLSKEKLMIPVSKIQFENCTFNSKISIQFISKEKDVSINFKDCELKKLDINKNYRLKKNIDNCCNLE